MPKKRLIYIFSRCPCFEIEEFDDNNFQVDYVGTSDDEEVACIPQINLSESEFSVCIFDIFLENNEEVSIIFYKKLMKVRENLGRKAFLIVYNAQSYLFPDFRIKCFEHGCSMVSHRKSDTLEILNNEIATFGNTKGSFLCPYCKLQNLTEDDIWKHFYRWHPNESPAARPPCPICRVRSPNLAVHMHNDHGPPGRGEEPSESREEVSSLYAFSLVMCRHPETGRYLLVQEFAHQGFWLPGGRVNPGETLTEAAVRETQEEAGVAVELKGVLSIEYHPIRDRARGSYVRLRVIFYAEPLDLAATPKCIPDYESLGAVWASAEEITRIKLRSEFELKQWVPYLEQGGDIYPLELLAEFKRGF